ncbi:hypothetical protein J8273_1282 [Carpediemonas membranifera]|uniref:Uncharacterized protein n=1 Tax=Carpediemonas membranifera TaxID=201153 RepID=A0A8J6AWZ8_9EUKA|nr:hypothetical protein J8273_1282 [Carpediemonas membranifera]|eukprot:KAG9396946.1 hypothetical protein J8273_1282 [Carpediemonas membranifera]
MLGFAYRQRLRLIRAALVEGDSTELLKQLLMLFAPLLSALAFFCPTLPFGAARYVGIALIGSSVLGTIHYFSQSTKYYPFKRVYGSPTKARSLFKKTVSGPPAEIKTMHVPRPSSFSIACIRNFDAISIFILCAPAVGLPGTRSIVAAVMARLMCYAFSLHAEYRVKQEAIWSRGAYDVLFETTAAAIPSVTVATQTGNPRTGTRVGGTTRGSRDRTPTMVLPSGRALPAHMLSPGRRVL